MTAQAPPASLSRRRLAPANHPAPAPTRLPHRAADKDWEGPRGVPFSELPTAGEKAPSGGGRQRSACKAHAPQASLPGRTSFGDRNQFRAASPQILSPWDTDSPPSRHTPRTGPHLPVCLVLQRPRWAHTWSYTCFPKPSGPSPAHSLHALNAPHEPSVNAAPYPTTRPLRARVSGVRVPGGEAGPRQSPLMLGAPGA